MLAAAVILTGEPGIRVPESTHSSNGIDAATVLGDWEPAEIQALLERAIFNDALYGLVRIRHREVRELLAAEWFHQNLNEGGSRHETESLFFREQYGHSVITPRLRPVLHWLILLDDEIRRKALEISPEIVIEGGDATRLPLSERQTILRGIVQRIADDEEDRSARDYSAIARIAQEDLTGDTFRLINDQYDNDEAIFFLSLLVWQGGMRTCVPALSGIAGDPARGIHARMAAARAVMTCGDRNQKNRLWKKLTASLQALPRRLLAEVVEVADPDMVSVNRLLASFEKLEDHNRYEATGLPLSLHDFIEPTAGQQSRMRAGAFADTCQRAERLSWSRTPHQGASMSAFGKVRMASGSGQSRRRAVGGSSVRRDAFAGSARDHAEGTRCTSLAREGLQRAQRPPQ